MIRKACVLLATAGWLACGGGAKPTARAPAAAETARGAAAPQPALPRPAPLIAPIAADAPPDLLGVAVVPNARQALADVVRAGRGIRGEPPPLDDSALGVGFGAMFGAGPVEGVDYDQPIWLLFVDPRTTDAPIVALVGVADAAALRRWADGAGVTADARGRVAVVGAPGAVAATGDYAVRVLAARKPPAHVTVTVSVDRLRARYPAEIDGFILAMKRATLRAPSQNESVSGNVGVDVIEACVRQADAASLSFEVGAGDLTVAFEIRGAPGSTMAKIASAQRPSDFAILDVFDVTGAAAFVAGDVQMGPLADAYAEIFSRLLPALGADPEADSLWKQLASQSAGPTALRLDLSPMRMLTAYAVRDGAQALRLHRAFAAAAGWGAGGVRTEPIATPAFTYRDVPVDAYKLSLSQDEAATAAIAPQIARWYASATMTVAAVDGYLVGITAPDAAARMRAEIDRLAAGTRGHGSKLAAVQAARERRESVVVWVDIGAIAGALRAGERSAPIEMAFGVGFTESSWLVRFTMPFDSIAAMSSLDDGAAAGPPPPPPTDVTPPRD
ncbi:MAG: hypothetical protein D6689_04230 [Deltaproteobacteria bacterium]|nr:MAG: hypothetical protein D6689_04230 [Deltaproteobacteria bacterium]